MTKPQYNIQQRLNEAIKKLEWSIYCNGGYKQLNGGYTSVKVDEEFDTYWKLSIEAGIQDMGNGYSENQSWYLYMKKDNHDILTEEPEDE